MILFRSRTFPGVQSTRPPARTRHVWLNNINSDLQSQSTRPGMFHGIHVVSIHAYSREDATPVCVRRLPPDCFNPRVLPEGRDLRVIFSGSVISVSIHAYSREDATFPRLSGSPVAKVSLHASSRADATEAFRAPIFAMMFQSTRPRGRTRLGLEDVTFNVTQFQSTRPRGRTRP